MQIYTFEPYFKSVIWGGDKILKLKHSDKKQANVGESWEVSAVPGHESVVSEGAEKGKNLAQLVEEHKQEFVGKHVYERYGNTFPLLVKIIDAKRDLSVQVHPDDALAAKRHNSLGKTEMWYLLDCEPGAKIYAGLSHRINPDIYEQLVAEGKIMDAVAANDARPGDVFFLPAGRIHAIGAGNLLAEIQETSDITYRVYDYGRLDANGQPRQLHTAEARDAIDYTVYPSYRTDYDHDAKDDIELIRCDHFTIDRVTVDGVTALRMPADSFLIVMCLDGECALSIDGAPAVKMPKGTSALVPACAKGLRADGQATLLTANC